MKKIFNLLTFFVLISCNSQSINNQFINSISTSVINSNTTVTNVQGKISITYPDNLSEKFQQIVNKYILEDLKLESCDGVDSKIQVRYNVRYNSNEILSIFKVVDYIFCDERDSTMFEPFVLYNLNGTIYNVTINESSNIISLINNFINVSNNNTSSSDCNYVADEIYKFLIIDNKQPKLSLVKDSNFCFSEINVSLQEDMLKFNIVIY